MATPRAKLFGTKVAAIMALDGDFAVDDHQSSGIPKLFAWGKSLSESLGLVLSTNRLYPGQPHYPEFDIGFQLPCFTLGAIALGGMNRLPTRRAVVQFGAIGQIFWLLSAALWTFKGLC